MFPGERRSAEEGVHEDVWDYRGAASTRPGPSQSFLEASDGQVGLTVEDGVNQLFVYPAPVTSSGEFTQAVIQVSDVRAAVEEMRRRGVAFEESDTPETRMLDPE